MTHFFSRFRPAHHERSDLDDDLYAFALYELTSDTALPEILTKADKWARDEEERDKVYVRLRVKHLREHLEQTALQAHDYLNQDYLQWKADAQSTPGELGTAWDDVMQQIRDHPHYGQVLHETGVDTFIKGSVGAIFFVLVLFIVFTVGPSNPTMAALGVGLLLLVFWIAFGVLNLWQRKST